MRKPKPIRREDLAPGACLCDHCTGKCCRYFSLPIDEPTTWPDYDRVEAYLAREGTLVYVDKAIWYLVVMTRCKYLSQDNRCKIYLNRPKVCQEYTTAECEYDTDWMFEKVFETPAQLREYAEALLRPRRTAQRGENRPTYSNGSFAIPIERPVTWDDYDAIRWYLAHERTWVYVERGKWRVVVETGRAGRGSLPDVAEDGRAPEKVFETAEQLWEYAEAVLPPRRRTRGAGPTLPIVSPG